jgi:hypothetical protein
MLAQKNLLWHLQLAMLAYACSMCQQTQGIHVPYVHVQVNVWFVHAGMQNVLLIAALIAHSQLVQSCLDNCWWR